jgi:hypothetical protein
MIILQLLGLFDIFIAFVLWDLTNGWSGGWQSLAVIAGILLLKGLPGVLSMCSASLIDISCVLIMLITIFFVLPWWVYLIFIILMVQKGLISLFSF